MSTDRPLEITEVFHRSDGRAFDFKTPNGWLSAVYKAEQETYLITNIFVSKRERRQQIGKFLLRCGLEHASTLKATYVTAQITTRECLDAMRNVFGEESIEVIQEGKYRKQINTEEDLTWAYLDYQLQHQHSDPLAELYNG